MKKINLTIFAGGSGNSALIKILSKIKDINLKIIVNCYDDGKSTGKLRSFINGMLGPSDVRKNISSLLDDNDLFEKKLKYIIDYRFKKIQKKNIIKSIFNNHTHLKDTLNSLPKKIYEDIFEYLEIFQKKMNNNSKIIDFALGNIIFSGIFIKLKNFNQSVQVFSKLFNKDEKIYNISDGENLFLCAIRKDGEVLLSEEEIVSKSGTLIDDIYLLKNKLSKKFTDSLLKLNLEEKKKKLEKLSKFPNINFSINTIIKNSDIILYGPGTVHSSLFPTYLTKNLSTYK